MNIKIYDPCLVSCFMPAFSWYSQAGSARSGRLTRRGCSAQALKDGSLQARVLQQLVTLVLDEADLLLSYGHEADLQAIAPQVQN